MYLHDPALESIRLHAESRFPDECCGLVLVDGTVIQLDNLSSTPRTSFEIDPARLIPHLKMIACVYHSHPNRPALASAEDILSCNELGIPFLIISIPSCELVRQLPEGKSIPLLGRTFIYGVSDCFSLVKDFYQQKMGIVLPEIVRPYFGWWLDEGNRLIEDEASAMGFEEVDEPAFGDVFLMKASNSSTYDHMAVYLGDKSIMHHTLMGLSRVDFLDGYWNLVSKKAVRYAG